MKVKKKAIDPGLIRTIPSEGFSWIDRRFIREGFIDPLSREAVLLYFFLTAVSDARGLSFYADPTISKLLKISAEELTQSRQRLIDRNLILYRYPIYQALPLPKKPSSVGARPKRPAYFIPRESGSSKELLNRRVRCQFPRDTLRLRKDRISSAITSPSSSSTKWPVSRK